MNQKMTAKVQERMNPYSEYVTKFDAFSVNRNQVMDLENMQMVQKPCKRLILRQCP